MKILVTGSHGFIGRHLVARLEQIGHEVVCFDRKAPCRLDLLHTHDIYNVLNIHPDIEAVIHLAAQISVQVSMDLPQLDMENNVTATLNLVKYMQKYIPRARLIFSSTCAVYGNQHNWLVNEYMVPKPVSPYGIHKLAAEHYCRWIKDHVIFRFGNVYGPGQERSNPNAVIPKFISRLFDGERVEVYGECTRDYVHVSDIVNGLVGALTYDCASNNYNVCNLGLGKAISTRTIADTIVNAMNKREIVLPQDPIIVTEPKAGDLRNICLDPSRAMELMSYKAEKNIADGIEELVEYFCVQKVIGRL